MRACVRVVLLFGMIMPIAFAGYAQNPPAGAANRAAATYTSGLMMGAPPLTYVTVVQDAPYSAVRRFERTRTLADGTHISSATPPTKLFRDSMDRTRVEHPTGGNVPQERALPVVEIRDQVAGYLYFLDVQNKVAHRYTLTRPEPTPTPRPNPPPSGASGAPATGGTVGSGAASGGGLSVSPSGVVCCSQLSTPPGSRPAQQAAGPPQPQRTVEKLGTQIIEGVECEGTLTTTIWPVGSLQNNDRPIVSVSEMWISPYLHLVVLQKDSDPRAGEVIQRLTNISQSEPDPILFQVPPDYTIVDARGPLNIRYTYPRP